MTTQEAIKQLQTEHDLIAGESDLDGSQFAPALLEALAMAIEVMQGDGDTISRKQAIDVATSDGAYGYISAEELAKLPPTQSSLVKESGDVVKDLVNDCISRQAAIDIERRATVDTNPEHFESHQKFVEFMDDAEISSFGRWQWSNGFNTALTAVGIDLKKLPSAQPERTCVNCGRTANNGGWYADGRTRCPIEEHYALPKDGFCHLWEKRNVTDDDYPKRSEE